MVWKRFWIPVTCVLVLLTEASISKSNCEYKPQDRFINCENVKLGKFKGIAVPQDPSILYFYLQNAGMTGIEVNAFSNVPHLQLLDLRNNLLTNLHFAVFSNLTQLLSLFLFNNKFTNFFDSRLFAAQRNLIYLNLDNNYLSFLSVDILKPLLKLNQLHLKGNPFICSTEMNITMNWCKMRTRACTVDCRKPDTSTSAMMTEVTLPEIDEITAVTVVSILKTQIYNPVYYNVTRKHFINDNSDKLVYQTTLIVVSLVFVIGLVLCFGFATFWFYRRRRDAKNEYSTRNNSHINSIWRFQRRNINASTPTRSYVSIVPDVPGRPLERISQIEYDDVLNVVQEEAEYISYVTPNCPHR